MTKNFSGLRSELAEIAAKAVVERFDCALGDGVQEGLARLIATQHRHEIAKHNASLPIRLVEEALSNMAERVMAVHREVMHNEASSEGEIAAGLSKGDLQTIVLEDFREENGEL